MVIEVPVHSVQLCDMETREIGDVLLAYKKRIEQIMSFESIKYVQVYVLIEFVFLNENLFGFRNSDSRNIYQ